MNLVFANNSTEGALKLARFRRRSRSSAFTLLEMVLVVAALSVLAGVGYIAFSEIETGASSVKIQSDVSSLNEAVTLYTASGGELGGGNTPNQILAKLKTQQTATAAATSAAPLTGSMIDRRLVAEMQTVREAATTQPRALWNETAHTFEVKNSGVVGVKRFRLDPALSDTEIITEARGDDFYAFNGTTGWVWDTGSNAGGSLDDAMVGTSPVQRTAFPTAPGVSTPAALNSAIIAGAEAPPLVLAGYTADEEASADATSGALSGEGGLTGMVEEFPDMLSDGGSGDSSSADSSDGVPLTELPLLGVLGAERLPRPVIDKPGGGYLMNEFPLEVQIGNEGDYEGKGKLIFRRGWDAWRPYTGPIEVQEDERLSVKAVTEDSEVNRDSYEVTESYYAVTHIFSGVTEGDYTDVQGGPALVYSLTENNSFLSHGRPVVVIGDKVIDGGEANTLKFLLSQFSGVTAGVPFRIGDLLFHNGTTYDATHATSTTLHVEVVFTEPLAAKELKIPLQLINTENSDDAAASADYIKLDEPDMVYPLELDGRLYEMTIAFGQADSFGFSTPDQFHAYEGRTARAALMATLTDKGPISGGNMWGDWFESTITDWLKERGYL